MRLSFLFFSPSSSISMSSNPAFRGRGRWQRTYTDRPTAATQQSTALTGGETNAASSGSHSHPRRDGPRGPRPFTGHYTHPSRGRGPAYSHRPPSLQPQFNPSVGYPAPGLGYSNQRPGQFHGQGLPYTGLEPQGYMQQNYNQHLPPQLYRAVPPNGIYGKMNVLQHTERPRQPVRPNKLALYMRRWKFAPWTVPPQCEKFRLLSYNILADYLAIQHSSLYLHVPTHIRSWHWRMNKLLFEFQLWSPDVLCLQEVDRFPDLQFELESQGYSGIWKIRTGNAIDGCAIFWRTKRFKLLHHEHIEFSQLGLKDNVAQICVLESVVQRTPENDSSSAKTSSNRIVVCNIHVLFNPKRGDIKIGQVRTLIHQAVAVSKSWGDAPIVLCGDFNSTPGSPLYKFILERKLDLSELARSEISGQKTGNALASAPGNHTFPRSTSSMGTMNVNREITERHADTNMGPCTTSTSPIHVKDPEEAQSNENKGLNLITVSDVTEISDLIGEDHVAETIQKENVPQSIDSAAAEGLQELDNGSSDVISSNNDVPLIEKLDLGQVSQFESLVEDDNVKNDFVGFNYSSAMNVRQPEETHESQQSNYAATSTNSDDVELSQAETLGLDNEILKGNCVTDGTDEENSDPNFLSELQGTQSEFGFNWTQDSYDPYKWTPDELKASTGSEDCTYVEHDLKLRSVYTDVEDNDGTKGPHGEPEATSYHRNFLGTVDYIWRSEGLKTVKVLDTIPKHILQETEGFPTKKWGSDHIALVCELAFTDE